MPPFRPSNRPSVLHTAVPVLHIALPSFSPTIHSSFLPFFCPSHRPSIHPFALPFVLHSCRHSIHHSILHIALQSLFYTALPSLNRPSVPHAALLFLTPSFCPSCRCSCPSHRPSPLHTFPSFSPNTHPPSFISSVPHNARPFVLPSFMPPFMPPFYPSFRPSILNAVPPSISHAALPPFRP